MMLATINWAFDAQDTGISSWIVEMSPVDVVSWTRIGLASPSDRTFSYPVDDGEWMFRVRWETMDGVLQSGDDPAMAPVTARADSLKGDGPSLTETAAPENAAVSPVDSTLTARVTFDAPASDDPPATVQVIEGSDASTGKILAEVPAVQSGPLMPDGARQMSATFPCEGRPDADKVLTMRGISAGGRPAATSATRTMRTPPMDGFHEVALVSISGATHTGMPAPAATDGFEYDGTDGLRLKLWPADGSSYGSDYGDGTTGMIAEQPFGSACVCRATVESDELDVGAVATFRLSIVDTIARKTAAGLVGALETPPSYIPLDPMSDRDVNNSDPIGPLWLSRETFADGSPRQPLRHCRWEYVVSDTSPVAHATGDFKPYVTGQFVRGRYLRVRVVLFEPTGWHQIICPTATVTAQLPRTPSVVQAGTPEASLSRPPGQIVMATTPGVAYIKASGIGNTGWVPIGGVQPQGIAQTGVITPPTLAANTNDWAPTGAATASVWRVSTDASRNLTGIAALATGTMLILINVGANDLVITHEDAASTAVNRIITPTAASVTVSASRSERLWYDATSSRWRIL